MLALLADLVVVVHLAFVAFVIAGVLLVWRWPRLAWAHVPCAAWGAWIELSGGICPLTPLEQWLRLQAGGPSYTGDFVDHYLLPVLYPEWLTRETQVVLGGLVVIVNAIGYGALVARQARRRRAAPTSGARPDGRA